MTQPSCYRTNNLGDIYEVDDRGFWHPFEPESFGWSSPGGANKPPEPRSLDQLQSLPGFVVTIDEARSYVPGSRPVRSVPWATWPDGAAPPAAMESKGGVGGILAYTDRLTDAFGLVAQSLPANPLSSPYIVHDFVGGRRFTISYASPPVQPGGAGVVYILDDGDALKIGHTAGDIALRVAGLQTGNPRIIRTVATIGPATEAVETHLHTQFDRSRLRGEWFNRAELSEGATAVGGWNAFLRQHLPDNDWTITIYLP